MSSAPTMTEARALAIRAEELLDFAREAGADEAEVAASTTRAVSLGFEKGEAKTAHVERSCGFGLRVFVDRRLGFVATNQISYTSFRAAAADAVALARSSPRDEANVLPARASPPAGSRVLAPEALAAALDPRLFALGVDEVVRRASSFVADVRARDPRLSIDRATLGVRTGTFLLRASNGLALEQTDAAASASVFGMAIDGSDVGGFDARGTTTRSLAALGPELVTLGERFAETALANLGAGAGESYRGPVLLAPEALRAMLLGPLLGATSAIAVQRKRSRFAERLGQPVAAASVTVRDDPTDLGLAGACSFDREGQPATRFALVERGVLSGFLYNGYAAAVDGTRSTGHAQGAAESSPGLGVHGLVVEPGDGGDLDALVRALGRGLVVQRFSGSVDAVSGDFSGVAKAARWVEGGVVVRSVREVLLAGNAFELLRGAVTLGSEAELVSGSARIPWALVDGFSVTAG
jgi:PmbA protein